LAQSANTGIFIVPAFDKGVNITVGGNEGMRPEWNAAFIAPLLDFFF